LLRRKIEVEGEDRLIFTVYGKGYRFGGEVWGAWGYRGAWEMGR
jgi:DNA-binding winged helix-turn-helix (wHTH) protein